MGNELQKRDFAQTLARSLHCLEVLANAQAPIRCTQVSEGMGVSRAAARRILLTLEHLGYVNEDDGRYSSAPKILSLGRGILRERSVWQALAPEVVALADKFNEPWSVSILDKLDIVFVCRDATRRIFTALLGIGDRLPAHCSASGKALLASLPEDELNALLRKTKLEKWGPASITRPTDLKAALSKVREHGFALAVDEMEVGTISIAVPAADAAPRLAHGG